MTTAQTIANLLNNDGQQFETSDGTPVDTLCDAHCPNPEQDWERGATRWNFDDGSSIIIAGEAWDFGIADSECCCFDGAGHSEQCSA